MKIFIHNVKISVFAYEKEGIENVKDHLKEFFPNIDFENKKEQISIEEQQIEEDDMSILTIYTKKQRYAKDFINNLKKNLSKEDKNTLLEQAKSRLDEKKRFFMRLDKKELLENNNYILTESGNCFHIKMNIACFPNTEEVAMKILRDLFG